MIFTLDTNVFIDALRQPPALDRLKAFLSWALPSTVLSSIVAAELTAGARSEKARRLLDDALLAAFERRARIIAPSTAAPRLGGRCACARMALIMVSLTTRITLSCGSCPVSMEYSVAPSA